MPTHSDKARSAAGGEIGSPGFCEPRLKKTA